MYNVRYRHLLPRRVYGTLGQGGLDTAHLINALRGALALGEVTSAPLLLVYRPHERCAFVYDGGGDVTDPAVVGGFLAEYRAGRVTPRVETGALLQPWRDEGRAKRPAERAGAHDEEE